MSHSFKVQVLNWEIFELTYLHMTKWYGKGYKEFYKNKGEIIFEPIAMF